MDPAIFKAYDIRGVYPDQLDKEAAWKIGYATARFLRSLLRGYQRGQANAQCLCVGRDMRTHSERLAQALIEGMNATGTNVIDIGMIDTPQMYFAINHLGTCGGVQVTASHNPARYNGFKISGLAATPIGVDTGLKDIEHIATGLPHTKARSAGSVKKRDLTKEYKNHVLKFRQPSSNELKLAVDASNGMAGKMVPAIFSDLPIQIVPLSFEHKGKFEHPPNPLIEKNLAQVKDAVRKQNCDFGICFDGDADRRHAFMKKAMRDSHAVFGGELSGHFYYRDNYCTDSAFITLVHVLNIVSEADVPISQLIQPLRRYYNSGEINFKGEDKQAKLDGLARKYSDAQIDYLDGVSIQYKDWWFNCRPSNTEPLLRLNVEAKSREMLYENLAELKAQLGIPV